MVTIESLFKAWIIDCDQRMVPISLQETQFKAISLFEMVKKKFVQSITEKQALEDFKASHGWWQKSCDREHLGSVKMLGESTSADHDAPNKYPATLRKIIEQGGYSEEQIFNVD